MDCPECNEWMSIHSISIDDAVYCRQIQFICDCGKEYIGHLSITLEEEI